MPELKKIEDAADAQLIQDLATSLAQRNAGLEPADSGIVSEQLIALEEY